MRLIPIKDALTFSPEENVPSVRGKVKEIYKPSTGSSDKGEWSFQNLVIVDESGQIKVKLKDREPLPLDYKGRVILISCKEGDKGLSGVKIKEDEYRGKIDKVLWVTPSATIDRVEGSAPAAPQQAQANGHVEQPKSEAPKQNGNGNGQPDSVKHVRHSLNRMANLYLHCMEAGNYVRSQWEAAHQVKMSEEQFQACVSSLYIQGSRDNLYDGLPIGSFDKQRK